jgi:hypothetical protein
VERAKWKRDENGEGNSKVKESSRVSGDTQRFKIYDDHNSTNTTARKKLQGEPAVKDNILIEGSTQRMKSFCSQQTSQKEKTTQFKPFGQTELCLFSQKDEQLTKNHQMKQQMTKLGELVAEDLESELRSRVTNPNRDSIFSNGQEYAEPIEMEAFSPRTETQEAFYR